MTTNFEIDRVHESAGDVERCADAVCQRNHMWSVYKRNLDKHGEGMAEWQSDHVDFDRAEQAAFAYRAMLMHSETKNNSARDLVRNFLEGKELGLIYRREQRPPMRFDIATMESVKYAEGFFIGYNTPFVSPKKARTK